MPLPAVRHLTLTANQVATVTIQGDHEYVGVLHLGNVENPVWATAVGTQNPTANGDDVYTVLPGTQRVIPRPGASGASTVRLLCAAAAQIEVEFS
jgi:hypothetical protein